MGPSKVLVDMQVNKELESAKNAAIAASKTEWDGEGLPPAGCECEFNAYDRGWEKCVVLYVSEYTALLRTDRASDPEEAFIPEDVDFRPIRSEADKKRENGVLSLAKAAGAMPFRYGETLSDGTLLGYSWYELYDKIAAGEVAGIRID